MGKVRGSKLLAAVAKAAGAPAKIANQVWMENIGEVDLAKRFITLDKLAEDRFRNDRYNLIWFLALANGALDKYTSEQIGQGFDDFLFPSIQCTSKPSKAALLKLARETRNAVDRFLSDRETGSIEFEFFPGRITRRIKWFALSPVATYRASFRAAFLMRLTDLLEEYGSKLRHCAASRCGLLFFANKRQIYCTKFCSRNERQKKLWAKLSPAQRREKRQKYYENQVRKKFGKARKVRHRIPETQNVEVQA
jgi:hypothetical protein